MRLLDICISREYCNEYGTFGALRIYEVKERVPAPPPPPATGIEYRADGKLPDGRHHVGENPNANISAPIFSCYTLERVQEGVERDKNLRIPAGKYKLRLDKSSMSGSKIKDGYLPLIWNENVPKDRLIRIHAGNYLKDTQGCILLGTSIACLPLSPASTQKQETPSHILKSMDAMRGFLEYIDLGVEYNLTIKNTILFLGGSK